MIVKATPGDPFAPAFEVDLNPARVDEDWVVAALLSDVDWGRWRTAGQLRAQIRGAWRVAGAYLSGTGDMVGFARAVSDGISIAYLADVLVREDCRGGGMGRALVTTMLEHEPANRFRWMLHADDARPFYARLGFSTQPSTYMERSPCSPVTGQRYVLLEAERGDAVAAASDALELGADGLRVSHAQNGEDVRLWRAFDGVEHGFYVEVGGWDPIEHSATWSFYLRGWSGLVVEPVSENAEAIQAKRPRDLVVAVAAGRDEGMVDLTVFPSTGLSTVRGDHAARHRPMAVRVQSPCPSASPAQDPR